MIRVSIERKWRTKRRAGVSIALVASQSNSVPVGKLATGLPPAPPRSAFISRPGDRSRPGCEGTWTPSQFRRGRSERA